MKQPLPPGLLTRYNVSHHCLALTIAVEME
jgi:hypothetical protein